MTEPRFTVQWLKRSPLQRGGGTRVEGWAVFERNKPITVTFETEEEAKRHRENIVAIYARYGW